jgi:hypothetical protein
MKSITPVERNKEIISFLKETHNKVKKTLPPNVVKKSINCNQFNKKQIAAFKVLHDKFVKSLLRTGFTFVDSGGFKAVYEHDAFPEFVVKVYNSHWAHTDDTNVKSLPKYIHKHVLMPITINKLYMIQPKANMKRLGKRGMASNVLFNNFSEQRAKRLESNDIRDDNVMFHNGQPMIVDFCWRY